MKDINEINFKPLEESISERLGIDIKLEVSTGESKNGFQRVYISSQNLKEESGFMKSLYNEIDVTDFGSSIFLNDNEEEILWIALNVSFTYTSGGSNGTRLGDAWYNFNKGTWKVEYR